MAALVRMGLYAACLVGLTGCGVGGLIAGAIAGAVLATSDGGSSGEQPPVAGIAVPLRRETIREQGEPAQVPICYKLVGSGGSSTADVEYALQKEEYASWRPATRLEAAPESGPPCDGAVFWWDAAADLDLQGKAEQVRIRVVPRGHSAGAAVSDPFLVGNTPPQVAFLDFQDSVGTIRVPFHAADAEQDPLEDVQLFYKLPQDEEYRRIQVLQPSALLEVAAPQGGGQDHVAVWSSQSDLAARRVLGLTIRLTAHDAFSQTVIIDSPPIEIDNNSAPVVLDFLGPQDPEGFEVPLSVDLSDADGHDVDIVVQYTTGDDFPALGPEFDDPLYRRATLDFAQASHSDLRRALRLATPSLRRPEAARLVALGSSPRHNGVHAFLWDSLADLPSLGRIQVRLKVTPFDTEERGFDRSVELTIDNDAYPEILAFEKGAAEAQRIGGVALGDLDGDGGSDMALSVTAPYPGRVDVFLRLPDGGFPSSPSLSLAPPGLETEAHSPTDLAVRDLNLDGAKDLVVLYRNCKVFATTDCSTEGRVGIYLGAPGEPGSVGTAPLLLPTGRDVRCLAVGDFDGEPGLDIAVSNHDSQSVTVHLMAPSGSYEPRNPQYSLEFPLSLPAEDRPAGLMAVGDLDGDGRDEIVVREREADLVEILRCDGGGLTRWGQVRVDAPVAVWPIDYDGQGLVDLAVGWIDEVTEESYACVYLNRWQPQTPDGGFAPPPVATIPLDSSPERIQAFSLRAGAAPTPEVVVLESERDAMELLRRDAAGSWEAYKEILGLSLPPKESDLPPCLAMSPCDEDSESRARPDLVVGSTDGAYLLRAEGAGTLPPRIQGSLEFRKSEGLKDLLLGDFNGDSLTDIAVASSDSNRRVYRLTMCYQDRRGGFSLANSSTLARQPDPATFQPTVFVAGAGSGAPGSRGFDEIALSRNLGVDVFTRSESGVWTARAIEDGLMPGPIVLGGLAGDDGLELARLDPVQGRIHIWSLGAWSPGSPPEPRALASVEVGPWPQSLAAGDFDGDGLTDLAVLLGTTGSVSILRQLPSGSASLFEPVAKFATGSPGYGRLYAVPLNPDEDGRLDLVVQGVSARRVQTYLQRPPEDPGTLRFERSFELSPANPPTALAVGMLGQMERPTLVMGLQGEPRLSVIYQRGRGAFNAFPSPGVALAMEEDEPRMAVGDVTGDSRNDLVILCPRAGMLKIVRAR